MHMKMKTKKTSAPKNKANGSNGKPTPEDIASLANSIWEQEGRPDGRHIEHWLLAESRLRRNQPQPASPV